MYSERREEEKKNCISSSERDREVFLYILQYKKIYI